MNYKRFSRALNIAMRYLSYRPRTTHEIRMHLKKKQFSEVQINDTIFYLEDHKFLNDDDFCCAYLEYHSRYKPKSIFAMGYDLKKKGICQSVIDHHMTGYDNYQLAVNCVKTRLQRWQNFDTDKLKNKIFNFLRYRGFNFETCLSVYEQIVNGELQ